MVKRKILFISFFIIIFLVSNSFIGISFSVKNENYLESLDSNGKNIAVVIGAGQHWIINSAIEFSDAIDTNYWDCIELLTDSDATKSNIISKIDMLKSYSNSGNNVLLFYFMGHSGRNFIKTADGNRIYDIELQAYFSGVLSKNYHNEKVGTNKLIFIFDTCYSGRVSQEKNKDNTIFNNLNPFFYRIINKIPVLKNLKKNHLIDVTSSSKIITNSDDPDAEYDGIFQNLVRPGRIIITACRRNQKSWSKGGISTFTYFLKTALDDTDYIETAFSSAKTSTRNYMWAVEGKLQNPQIADRIIDDVRVK